MAAPGETLTPGAQVQRFLARYTPDVRKTALTACAALRRLFPGATELVYDNYNALVIGFGPNDRPSDAWFSVVLYPRYVRLFWLDGAALDDPDGLLEGQGNRVRSLRLDPDAGIVSAPAVQSLLKRAVATSDAPYNPKARRRLIIRSVSAKRRPRRVPSSSIAR